MAEPDRRRSPRTPTLKEGRIVLFSHYTVIKCTVRNISPEGALLVVPSVIGIPDAYGNVRDIHNAFVWIVFVVAIGSGVRVIRQVVR